MLHQSAIKPNGFRELSPAELGVVSGGSGNEIIVTGNRGDAWTVSVSPDDLALLGIFHLGGGGGLPGTTDQFGGDGGGGGGGLPSGINLSEEDRESILNTNEDSEKQEAIERVIEGILEEIYNDGNEWTVEYNENTNIYNAISSDGSIENFLGDQAEQFFDSRVA